MASEKDVLWQRHEELRARVEGLEQKMAVAEERHVSVLDRLDENKNERRAQFETLLSEVKATRDELTEYRGMAKFGKWAIATLIALGVPPAMIYWFTHGGGK